MCAEDATQDSHLESCVALLAIAAVQAAAGESKVVDDTMMYSDFNYTKTKANVKRDANLFYNHFEPIVILQGLFAVVTIIVCMCCRAKVEVNTNGPDYVTQTMKRA